MKKNKDITAKVKSEKGKRLHKFYVLDAVIILLLLSIILGIFFRYNAAKEFSKLKKQTDVQVTFSVKNIKDTTRYYINIGDSIYFRDNKKDFGTIMESSDNSEIALIFKPSEKTFFVDGENITVNYPSETQIDADGRMKCSGIFASDGSFMLNGTTYICAGQTYTVCNENATIDIIINEISPLES